MKTGVFWHFFPILTVFRSLCLSGAILAHQTSNGMFSGSWRIFWHPWDLWGQIHIDLNKNSVRTGCVLPWFHQFLIWYKKTEKSYITWEYKKVWCCMRYPKSFILHEKIEKSYLEWEAQRFAQCLLNVYPTVSQFLISNNTFLMSGYCPPMCPQYLPSFVRVKSWISSDIKFKLVYFV